MLKLKQIDERTYSFEVCLAYNALDTDYEGFSRSALEEMARLYVGETGTFSFDDKTYHPRIYETWLMKKGDASLLMGRAVIYLSPEEAAAVDRYLFEHQEYSVSCRVKAKICSVCGANVLHKRCMHQKGQRYNGSVTPCYYKLEDVEEVYDWGVVEQTMLLVDDDNEEEK